MIRSAGLRSAPIQHQINPSRSWALCASKSDVEAPTELDLRSEQAGGVISVQLNTASALRRAKCVLQGRATKAVHSSIR